MDNRGAKCKIFYSVFILLLTFEGFCFQDNHVIKFGWRRGKDGRGSWEGSFLSFSICLEVFNTYLKSFVSLIKFMF